MLNRLLLLGCFLIMLASVQNVCAEPSLLPDRRKPQFQKDPGYYLFPSPFSVPGVGEGVAVVGLGMNLWDSHTDLFGFLLTGGLEGIGIGIIDVHLIPQTLILDLNAEDLNSVTVPSFSKRGMKSDKRPTGKISPALDLIFCLCRPSRTDRPRRNNAGHRFAFNPSSPAPCPRRTCPCNISA